MKNYLFVGGVLDGQVIATNGTGYAHEGFHETEYRLIGRPLECYAPVSYSVEMVVERLLHFYRPPSDLPDVDKP